LPIALATTYSTNDADGFVLSLGARSATYSKQEEQVRTHFHSTDRRHRSIVAAFVVAMLLSTVHAHAQLAPGTERLSVRSDGTQADLNSRASSASLDGRFVAFDSSATNLVPGDTKHNQDVFVRDRVAGTTERLSVSSTGEEGKGDSVNPSISGDGRFVAFESAAWNLVADDTNSASDVFVHDRQTGTTTRVSVSGSGDQANSHSFAPAISADGRYVAYESYAKNLVTTPTLGVQIYLFDRDTGSTTLASAAPGGVAADGNSFNPAISADGRFIAFESFSSNLGGGSNSCDVYVFDRDTGTTTDVSVAFGGGDAFGCSYRPAISGDGRYVAYESTAKNIVVPFGNTEGVNVYVYDRTLGKTQLVNHETPGLPGAPVLCGSPEEPQVCLTNSGQARISADGRFVTFMSDSWRLLPGNVAASEIYVADRLSGQIRRASVNAANQAGGSCNAVPAISADGYLVSYKSSSANLVPGDTNGATDIFAGLAGAFCQSDADCNDGNPCRDAGVCDVASRRCTIPSKPDGTPCGTRAGVVCSIGDTCLDGACVAGGGGDSDDDLVCDTEDNCPLTPNPDQKDLDHDTIGNICDAEDAPLTPSRIRVRRSRRPTNDDGGIWIKLAFVSHPPDDTFTTADGIFVTVWDRSFVSQSAQWSGAECRTRGADSTVCRKAGKPYAYATFRRLPVTTAGAQTIEASIRMPGLNMARSLAPPLNARVTSDPGVPIRGVDRVGALSSCKNVWWGVSCVK
jgi:Tol biopolymer transport system component